MRQIVLDTETTGLDLEEGHRIIEIGCVELINRRPTGNNYHQYIQPDRDVEEGALDIHGITNAFLADKPRFADIAQDFLEYTKGAELIIHNAPFDVGFINYEFASARNDREDTTEGDTRIEEHCKIEDTLVFARKIHPGQKNDLDSLCKRYSIDNSQRSFHGALLDAEILADVYLAMTGGQTGLFDDGHGRAQHWAGDTNIKRLDPDRPPLLVIRANEQEMAVHETWLDEINQTSDGRCLWRKLDALH